MMIFKVLCNIIFYFKFLRIGIYGVFYLYRYVLFKNMYVLFYFYIVRFLFIVNDNINSRVVWWFFFEFFVFVVMILG